MRFIVHRSSVMRRAHAGLAVLLALSTGAALTPAADQAPSSVPVRGGILIRPDSLGRFPLGPSRVEPATRDTMMLENEPPEPRASYGTFPAASESVAVLLRRTLGGCADSALWTRGRTSFLYRDKLTLGRAVTGQRYWFIEPRSKSVSVPSLVVHLTTTRADCPGDVTLRESLAATGWVENFHYSADGPDGTDFAFSCREALCQVEMLWDGGDDSDSTVVPQPGYSLVLTCVPRPREDPMLRRARR